MFSWNIIAQIETETTDTSTSRMDDGDGVELEGGLGGRLDVKMKPFEQKS